MPTVQQYAEFFSGYNPSGGGAEEWNMWCQAFVARASKAAGRFVRDYPSARAARLASGPLNTDLGQATPGVIGYWLWSPDDHVAVYLGGGLWMMGSRHIDERWGGVARNAGVVSHGRFQALAGLAFLGWAPTNGGNVVPVEIPGPGPTQRQVAGANARRRSQPFLAGLVLPTPHAAGAVVNVVGFRTDGDEAGGTTLWYFDGEAWSSASVFTEVSTHDLPDLTPPPVVIPDPEPEPEPEVPEPEPEVPEPEPEVPEPEVPEPEPEPEVPEPEPEVPTPVPSLPRGMPWWVYVIIAAGASIVAALASWLNA